VSETLVAQSFAPRDDLRPLAAFSQHTREIVDAPASSRCCASSFALPILNTVAQTSGGSSSAGDMASPSSRSTQLHVSRRRYPSWPSFDFRRAR
jgi:hypothetical protein